jgi:hypothetical protein
VGTDDGLLHVSRDDGDKWQKVTPKDLPEWSYIGAVEISAHKADTIYLSATRYKLDDYNPYLYRSQDGGKSWQSINGNFPTGEITRVIRSDAIRPGLLFVGTETGIFYSLDDGQQWSRMRGGLPVAPVYDLKIKDADLVAATHGRSFWILDDITPLREMPISTDRKVIPLLFTPRPTYRLKLQWAAGVFDGDGKDYSPAFGLTGTTYRQKQPDGTTVRRHLDVGENPPGGAIIYYWLKSKQESAVELSICDKTGVMIESFSSAETEKPERRLPANSGLNRFVWNLSYQAAKPLDPSLATRDYEPLAQEPKGRGPAAPPGRYDIRISVGGRSATASLLLLKDPRVDATQADLDEQFELLQELTAKRSELHTHVDRIRRMKRQLDDLIQKLPKGLRRAVSSAISIRKKLEVIENTFVDTRRESPRDELRHPAGLDDTLGGMMWCVTMSDTAPPAQTREVSVEVVRKIDGEIRKLNKLVDGPIATLNAKVGKAGVPAIIA